MQEPHSEGVAHHTAPESCAGHRKVTGEALTGESADRVLSRESFEFGVPTLSRHTEGHTGARDKRERAEDPTRSKTPSMRGRSLDGKREVSQLPCGEGPLGRSEKAECRTPDMHVRGKSDDSIVPAKRTNKADLSAAEPVEERESTKGNAEQTTTPRTQCRTGVTSGLRRVREADDFASDPR